MAFLVTTTDADVVQIATPYATYESIAVVDVTPTNPVRTSSKPEIPVPAGARMQDAMFLVTVDPPGRAQIGDVAEVRENPPKSGDLASFTMDFSGLRTVSAFELPVAANIEGLFQWMGTGFADKAFFIPTSSAVPAQVPSVQFSEVLTERVRVDLNTAVSLENFLLGEVVIPTPPQSAEILVNGVRAWFSVIDATSTTVLPGDSIEHSLAAEVDLRAAIQTALEADGSVVVELKASGPCQMKIEAPSLSFLRTHSVKFSDGPNRTIDAPTEGTYIVELPLDGSAGANNWQVREVEVRVIAELEPKRVQPPSGPTLATDIELTLTGERALLVKLPPELVSKYKCLTGIRLPVRAASGGAELSGELLLHDVETNRPGEPLPDVTFTPLNLDETSDFTYSTLAFAEKFEPVADTDYWVSLRASRGELAWALGEASSAVLSDAEIRWRAPSGSARMLSLVADVAAMRGAIRLVGEADPNRPIAAVELQILGRAISELLTPLPNGVQARFVLGQAAQITPNDQGSDGLLQLELVVSAPGQYTFDSAVIIYRDPALDGGP